MKPIPEGDRFADDKLFRVIGTGAGYKLYEVWEDAVHAHVADRVRAAKVAALREAAKWFSSFQQIDYHGTAFAELHRMADEIEKGE